MNSYSSYCASNGCYRGRFRRKCYPIITSVLIYSVASLVEFMMEDEGIINLFNRLKLLDNYNNVFYQFYYPYPLMRTQDIKD